MLIACPDTPIGSLSARPVAAVDEARPGEIVFSVSETGAWTLVGRVPVAKGRASR